MRLYLLLALIYDGVLVTVCFYALVRGGRPERVGAILTLIASIATVALRWLGIVKGEPAEIVMMMIDASVLGGFFWLAIRTTRFWPIWAFGFALADIVISLAGALLPKTPFIPYHTGLGIYAYLALVPWRSAPFASRATPPSTSDGGICGWRGRRRSGDTCLTSTASRTVSSGRYRRWLETGVFDAMLESFAEAVERDTTADMSRRSKADDGSRWASALTSTSYGVGCADASALSLLAC